MKSNIIFNQGDRLKNGSLENTHTHTLSPILNIIIVTIFTQDYQ